MDALTSLVILSPLKFTTSPRVERGMPILLTARTPLCARQSNRRADTDLLPFPIMLTKAPFIVSMISNNHPSLPQKPDRSPLPRSTPC